MQETAYVFPIVGGRKVEHLMSNIEALNVRLSDKQIKYLESIVPLDPGFPPWFIVSIIICSRWSSFTHAIYFQGDGTKTVNFIDVAGNIDLRPIAQPLRPVAKT